MVSNGSVIQVYGQPAIYFVEDGLRRHIPDMSTFWSRDFYPGQVLFISEAEMNSIPLGAPLPFDRRFEYDVNDFLGSGHYMSTRGVLSTYSGVIQATTVTRSVTWFGGFHGGVVIAGFDQSPQQVPL